MIVSEVKDSTKYVSSGPPLGGSGTPNRVRCERIDGGVGRGQNGPERTNADYGRSVRLFFFFQQLLLCLTSVRDPTPTPTPLKRISNSWLICVVVFVAQPRREICRLHAARSECIMTQNRRLRVRKTGCRTSPPRRFWPEARIHSQKHGVQYRPAFKEAPLKKVSLRFEQK